MSKTIRWYQKKENLIRFRNECEKVWKLINPYHYFKDCKMARIELRRRQRHRNKIRISKNLDILPELRTEGWGT